MANDVYAEEFADAEQQYVDRVRGAVRSRAIDGWLEPVVYKGRLQYEFTPDPDRKPEPDEPPYTPVKVELVAVRRFSERLLEALAKAKAPEFREKLELGADQSLSEILSRSFEPAKGKK
jgi:hypothetical protein